MKRNNAIFAWLLTAFFLCATPLTGLAQTYDRNQRLIMPDRPTTNYSFLEGCWKTDPFQHGPGKPIATSTYCFDANGRGTLVFERPGRTCRAEATASYQGSKLRIEDSDGPCTPDGSWSSDKLDCERRSDGVASCSGESFEKVDRRNYRWTVTLRRQGPPPAARESAPPPASPSERPAPDAKSKSLESLFERR